MYAVYGLFCAVLFVQLIRSVMSDLYGKPRLSARAETATSCLEDVQRLFDQLTARAVQPAPQGVEGGALAREWDQWSRRWEADVDGVSARCGLDAPSDDARRALAEALDGLEQMRRRLSRSGEDAAAGARQVKEDLSNARRLLKLR